VAVGLNITSRKPQTKTTTYTHVGGFDVATLYCNRTQKLLMITVKFRWVLWVWVFCFCHVFTFLTFFLNIFERFYIYGKHNPCACRMILRCCPAMAREQILSTVNPQTWAQKNQLKQYISSCTTTADAVTINVLNTRTSSTFRGALVHPRLLIGGSAVWTNW